MERFRGGAGSERGARQPWEQTDRMALCAACIHPSPRPVSQPTSTQTQSMPRAARLTMVLPAFSGRLATSTAACTAAPEEMPTCGSMKQALG